MTLIETTEEVVRFSCLQALLKGAGIDTQTSDSPADFAGTRTRHEIVVSDADAQRARSLIADFDASPVDLADEA